MEGEGSVGYLFAKFDTFEVFSWKWGFSLWKGEFVFMGAIMGCVLVMQLKAFKGFETFAEQEYWYACRWAYESWGLGCL